MERFITGEKFKLLADHVFVPGAMIQVANGDIVYSDLDYARDLAGTVSNMDEQVIVITHNGDKNIDFTPPDNVIKWFSTNVNISHPRIESIPIGLENDMWFPDVRKKEKMLAKMKEPKRYYNLIYMNHSIVTNPEVRGRLYDMFGGETWVTSFKGSNRGELFDQYLENIDRHKFMICPEGNGIDTHRLWECLYMRCIPIEKRNINNQFYTDLPICFVDEWEEITENFLNDEYERMIRQHWNLKKLNMSYWEDKIRSHAS